MPPCAVPSRPGSGWRHTNWTQAVRMNAKFRNEGFPVVMAPLSRINSTQNRRVQPGEHYQLVQADGDDLFLGLQPSQELISNALGPDRAKLLGESKLGQGGGAMADQGLPKDADSTSDPFSGIPIPNKKVLCV